MNDMYLEVVANKECPSQPCHKHRVKKVNFLHGELQRDGSYGENPESKSTFGQAEMECIFEEEINGKV